ncbi:DNA-directed RNA polymerase II subunit RPB4 [Rhodotorula paludigena]|uniref:RNA polymerase Rpb4/RPC9 core domain-containing protein n=1 Tax=Rhodotorula paludigena TaxID=86838 RepID=A0AAV5GCN3_9BASI|nr:hypothetical protein Rhopal_003245-T1 [Rhodotorula paludigena]
MSRVTDRHKADDEDVAQLKFGASFTDGETQMLSISEVRLLLDGIERSAEENGKAAPDTAVYNKTKDYVNTFARFRDNDLAEAVRGGLPAPDFHEYESVQLMNLCPMEAEEAKALVPSLKMDDETLQQHLSELTNARKGQQNMA